MIITIATDVYDTSKSALILSLSQDDLDRIEARENLEMNCTVMGFPVCAVTLFKAEDEDAVAIVAALAKETASPMEIVDLRGQA